MDKKAAMGRHPAGKKQTIHDTAWALKKAVELGANQREAEILDLIDTTLKYMDGGAFSAVGVLKELREQIES